jgi:hypothetical protein
MSRDYVSQILETSKQANLHLDNLENKEFYRKVSSVKER